MSYHTNLSARRGKVFVAVVDHKLKFELIMATLTGKTIAILTEIGFEEVELTEPKKALEAAGATVHIVSPQQKVKAFKEHQEWTIELDVDKNVKDAKEEDYDGLMIPGGVINPDLMRANPDCVKFARSFFEAGKPVAAICHGPQLLIEAGVVKGKTMTSYPSIKTDLINAGANWVDKEVVVDQGFVTSRSPKDLVAFNKKMVEEFREGIHAGMHA
jgi:deglycase